ncbi:hypothetical protein DENIS_1585 [Desulfonema ishimotonii]|uniref:Cyclic nucleotide-binding domain-containing protein n=1 Tax=Desulfonema ishimotonii TaxID=45657 RepID=A0A401FUK5_9BACT|nr:cyclic nucleotide-binding domain-containing protein [Desulfonema ishimotonii]GBC60628.1 hypothetical protein DENIS_1585 [Desulfonema ishimotonii]
MSNKVVLSGSLEFLGLGDILQLIGSNGSSGILRVISKYSAEPGQVYFSKGSIIHATSPSLSGLDAAYALFGWAEGVFEFVEEAVSVKKTIRTSRMEIILDGLRMVDDGVTQKMGAVSFDDNKESSGEASLRIPVLKGPLVDYMYVLDEESFYQNRKIVQENKHGSWIWAILEGTVDIIKETPKGPLTIIRLGPGAFIGGVTSFSFHENVRTATAQAATDVQLGVLDAQRMAEEYGNCSLQFRDVALSLDRRRNEITERAVDIYLKQDNLKKITQGKKLMVRQGKKEEKLFRIDQGEVAVVRKTKAGYLPLALLGPGDFIGPVPFYDIGHEPQLASVFASEDVEFSPLDAQLLLEEYDQLSSTLKNLIEGIATSISITTRVAYDFLKINARKK